MVLETTWLFGVSVLLQYHIMKNIPVFSCTIPERERISSSKGTQNKQKEFGLTQEKTIVIAKLCGLKNFIQYLTFKGHTTSPSIFGQHWTAVILQTYLPC